MKLEVEDTSEREQKFSPVNWKNKVRSRHHNSIQEQGSKDLDLDE